MGHCEHFDAFQERTHRRSRKHVSQPLLQEAAGACHKEVGEFLLDARVTAAEQTLADRRQFVPVMILARLAVGTRHHRKGFGQALLKDALLRTAQAADIAGIRRLLVHAKDDAARQW